MSSLSDAIKCIVEQLKVLQERLNIMESEQSLAIFSPQSIPISIFQATPTISGNQRDIYDPFSPNMLNPHNTGATTTEGNANMVRTSVPFPSWESFGSFVIGMVGKTTTQASGSGEKQSTHDNVFFWSRRIEQSGNFGSSFVGGDPTTPPDPFSHLRPPTAHSLWHF